jgi:catechol 2,3-dioxygenase-like lactoylglutathione lyase family enzyme
MSVNVTAIVPLLPAREVAASLAWLTGICGFTERFRQGDPVSYAGLERGAAGLHLGLIPDAELASTIAGQTVTRIMVDDADAMLAEFLARSGAVHPNGALADKPWGTREFATIDPAGVLVWFSQALNA